MTSGYEREVAIRTGVNRKRQVNLFDPDGTPAPSSTLPPPR
jgi:lactoylglutathione lyase